MSQPFRGVSKLVLAALVAAGCNDAVSPGGPRAPTRPLAATSAGGVALDQQNGSMNDQNTTVLLKGFNPTNPHRGDAIVATFFWLGSSNIITSVTDHLANGAPVGNTYTLVDYVTANGYSMATYVATDVQNFPDAYGVAGGAQDSILVVQANLSQAVTDGGMQIAAYTGVAPLASSALGAHQSASGSGEGILTEGPGAIALGAGAVAHAVTMVNGLFGYNPPPGFSEVGEGDDPSMKEDGEYLVSGSATTVNPQWTWFFDSTRTYTWVATVVALNPGSAPANQPPTAAFTSSCNGLTCTFTNTSSDPDGTIASNAWDFGDGTTSTAQSPSHTYGAGGTYTVTLTVTDNGGATNSTSHTVTVAAANQSPTAAFTSSCSGLTCTFTNTSSDPDGTIASNAWDFGDGTTSTAQSPSHTYGAGGTYTVTLTVTDNGGATNSTSHTVTVAAANQSPTAAFTSSCSGLTCTFTNTSSDPDGTIASNAWDFGDGTTSTAQNPSHTYGAGGTYTVTLTVTDNQGATNSITHTVTVSAPNQPPVAQFSSSCSDLTCTFTNSSSDPDGTVASNAWDFGDGATSTAQSPSHTYGAGGTYTVTLTVTDNQGATNSVTHTVTVSAPNQPPVAQFSSSCSDLTCSFANSSSDPDGSITAYQWDFGDGTTSTAQNPSHTYADGGTYTVTLTVQDNDGATSSVSHDVTVTAPNQAPVVNAGPDETVLLGVLYTLNASFSDPDNGPWTYTINWGDGSTSSGSTSSTGTISATHTYLGILTTRTVVVTVTDSRGASGSDSKQITLIL